VAAVREAQSPNLFLPNLYPYHPPSWSTKEGGVIELPFPPSSLSGHTKGHWRSTAGIVAKHRAWARAATLAARPAVPASGDIRVVTIFYPPDRRGDRINFPNRMKPYFDGIADALGVNDSRFLPAYHFAEPVKNGRVVIVLGEG
jgi:hypothetical protein